MRGPLMRANAALLLTAAWLLAFANFSTWRLLRALDPGALSQPLFLVCLGTLLAMTILVVLLPLSFKGAMKPWLILVLLLAAAAAFFMDDFGAMVDRHTLRSVFETDAHEAGEWLSGRMFRKLAFTGLVPALLVAWTRIDWQPWRSELWSRTKLVLGMTLACAIAIGIGGRGIASSLRTQRDIGHVINPMAIASGLVAYIDNARPHAAIVVQPLGRDAKRSVAAADAKPRVLVFVAGESVRASSWGLSGYARDTTPEQRALGVLNFADVRSCGTDTAVSLPCMFSDLGRRGFSERKALSRENLLDVLKHAGVDVRWFDNNTGSKGIASRVLDVELQRSDDPRWCKSGNCLDGMLVARLQQELATVKGDTAIVLHLKGSHGPAYYERYPQEFERFTPICRSNQLQRCTREQIINTYDNTVLYTDHVVGEVIRTLQATPAIDGAMLFVSDHGESTGENGLYLHGTPYALAPDTQTRVPMTLWMSPGFAQNSATQAGCPAQQVLKPWSHDNVFDLVLGLMRVNTHAARPTQDPLHICRTSQGS